MSEINSLNSKIEELEKVISEKDEIIVTTSAEIQELKAKNTELSQYKEKFEKAEQEKIKAEIAQKKEDLISFVVKSGQISREEIETSEELKGYVDNLDKKSLMAIVGERVLASSNVENVSNVEIETSESKVALSSNLTSLEDDDYDAVSMFRKNFLNK